MFFFNSAALKASAFKPIVILICMIFSLSACDNFDLTSRDDDSVTEPRSPTDPSDSSVAMPTFSPAPGTVNSGTQVTISTLTTGATIYYTLDGSTPTTSSPEYTAPVALPDGTVDLRAFAVQSGFDDSNVTAGTYTVGDDGSLDPYQEVGGSVQFPAEGFHERLPDPNGQQWEVVTQAGAFDDQMISSPNITDSNTIQNIINDPIAFSTRVDYKINFTTPGTYFVSLRWFGDTSNANVYIGLDEQKIPSPNASQDHFRFTDAPNAFAWDPANNGPYAIEVTSAGEHTFHMWMRQSALKLDHVFLSMDQNAVPPPVDPVDPIDPPPPVDVVSTPVISPASGNVQVGDVVTITTETAGANIYYTTDGTAPTSASTPYTAPVPVTDDDADGLFQINAIALLDGLEDSEVASASYTVGTTSTADSYYIEAEEFDASTADPSGNSWVRTTPDGAIAGAAIIAPNVAASADDTSLSARVDYTINFANPGTYYVWLRWPGNSGNIDVYVGLDGDTSVANDDYFQFTRNPGDWTWDNDRNGPFTIDVATAGTHTLNVWHRRPDLELDAIYLTLDPSDIPAFNSDTGGPVNPTDPTVVETPVISPANGSNVQVGDIVSISTGTAGATIYYTTDGTDPTSASTPYSSGIAVTDIDADGQFQVKAIALLDGLEGSEVASASYTVGTTSTADSYYIEAEEFDASTADPSGNSWVRTTPDGAIAGAAIIAPNVAASADDTSLSARVDYTINFANPGMYSVWLRWPGNSGNIDVYVGLDGDTSVANDDYFQFTRNPGDWTWDNDRNGPFIINVATAGTHTLNVWHRRPDLELDAIYLTLDPSDIPAFDSNTGGPVDPTDPTDPTDPVDPVDPEPAVVAPSFNPPGGNFTSDAAVSISTTTEGASIYYTTDGSDPTVSSTQFTTPISVTSDMEIRAIGYLDGEFSTVSSASYRFTTVDPDGRLFQEQDGVVAMEAENFSRSTAAAYSASSTVDNKVNCTSNCEWEKVRVLDAGQGVAVSAPQDAYNYNINGDFDINGNPYDYKTLNARLDYRINFATGGQYYLWLRGRPGSNLHLFVGVNGLNPTDRTFQLPTSGSAWVWGNNRSTPYAINVEAGTQTLNLWMRKNTGPTLDCIILTQDPGFSPGEECPAESPSSGVAAESTAPTITPDGGAFNGSVEVSMNAPGTIYFTRDGTKPTPGAGSTETFNPDGGPITVAETTEIWAIAIQDGFGESEITKARFDVQSGSPLEVYQEADGVVIMEAERFMDFDSGDDVQVDWGLTSLSGATGDPFINMIQAPAPDNSNPSSTPPYYGSQPSVSYFIDVTQTGTYYVWIRSLAYTGSDDTVRVALNEEVVGESVDARIQFPGTSRSNLDDADTANDEIWVWTNTRVGGTGDPQKFSIDLSASGVHRLSLVMRELNFRADRILLTSNPSFNPNDTPPASGESKRTVGSPTP